MHAMWRTAGAGALMVVLAQGCADNWEDRSYCAEGFSCGGEPVPPEPSPQPTPGENYVVTARPATNGAVRITSEPARINCLNNDNTQGDRCVEDFPANSRVRLIATVQAGHTFVQWDGGPCNGGTGPECIIAQLTGAVTTAARTNPVTPPPSNRITWTGAASNVWSIAQNWDLNRVPAAGDEVFIGPGGSATIRAGTAAVTIERMQVNGALVVEAGVVLRVVKDITGSGSLGVLSDGNGDGDVEVGQASSIGSLSSSGRIASSSVGGSFDDKPTFRVGQATFTPAVGQAPAVAAPTFASLQLEASQSVTVTDDLGLVGGATLRIPSGAQLTWNGPALGGVSMGSGGQFIGSCRLQNAGTMTVQAPLVMNCRFENSGTLTLSGNATFTARGVNRGTIRSLALFGTPGRLTFRGQSGDAPHWVFEPTSIMNEGLGRITIEAGSVIEGRVGGTSLLLDDVSGTVSSSHEVHLGQVTIDTLLASASLVDLRFAGTFDLDHLNVTNASLRLPAGANVLQARQTTLGSAILQDGIVEAQDVVLGGGTNVLAGRLWVTGLATAVNTTLLGRTGGLELRGGTLDLNPGSTNAIDIRTERETVGADLVVVNNGLIRKRGAGTARIRACFQGGVGTVSNEGSVPVTIEGLQGC